MAGIFEYEVGSFGESPVSRKRREIGLHNRFPRSFCDGGIDATIHEADRWRLVVTLASKAWIHCGQTIDAGLNKDFKQSRYLVEI